MRIFLSVKAEGKQKSKGNLGKIEVHPSQKKKKRRKEGWKEGKKEGRKENYI